MHQRIEIKKKQIDLNSEKGNEITRGYYSIRRFDTYWIPEATRIKETSSKKAL